MNKQYGGQLGKPWVKHIGSNIFDILEAQTQQEEIND